MAFLNRSENPEDADLSRYENGDYFINLPQNTVTDEEEMLVMQRDAENREQFSQPEQKVQSPTPQNQENYPQRQAPHGYFAPQINLASSNNNPNPPSPQVRIANRERFLGQPSEQYEEPIPTPQPIEQPMEQPTPQTPLPYPQMPKSSIEVENQDGYAPLPQIREEQPTTPYFQPQEDLQPVEINNVSNNNDDMANPDDIAAHKIAMQDYTSGETIPHNDIDWNTSSNKLNDEEIENEMLKISFDDEGKNPIEQEVYTADYQDTSPTQEEIQVEVQEPIQNSPQYNFESPVEQNSPVAVSSGQSKLYDENDWNGNDTTFEDSIKGTVFHEPLEPKPEPEQETIPPPQPILQSQQQAPFVPLTKPQAPQPQRQPTYQPSQSFQPQQKPELPSFQENIPRESFDEEETESESLLSSPNDSKPKTDILSTIKGIFNKNKSPKKEKPKKAKSTKKKSEDESDNKKENDPKKVAVLVLLLFVLAGAGYFVFSMIAPGLFATNNGAQQNNNKKQNKKSSIIVVEDRSGNIPQNPFVAKGQVAALAVVEGVFPKKEPVSNQGSNAGTQRVVVPPASTPRFNPPAIPQASAPVTRRMVPAIPATSAKPSASAPQTAVSNSPKLTGIIESDGGSVAVMSDGTVVSSGDTYSDGRIAYIGGDGIHFDNGKTITFEE